jgi:hypothetical protein
MLDLSTLGPEHFEELQGTIFDFSSDAGELPLQLASVERYSTGSRGRVPFSVFWIGPQDAGILAQGTRRCRHAELGELELFLVPIEVTGGRARYQAVFG